MMVTMASVGYGSDMDHPVKVGEVIEYQGRKWRVIEAMPPRRLSDAEKRLLKTDADWMQVRGLEPIEVAN